MSFDEDDPFEFHAERFLSRLQGLTQSFRSSSESVAVLLLQFDRHRSQFDAAFDWAESHLNCSESAAAICVRFAECGDLSGGKSLLDFRQTPAESRHWIDRALDGCRRLGWRNSEAVMRHQLAGAMFGEGRFDEAIVQAEFTHQHFLEAGNQHQTAITLNLLGVLSLAKGNAEQAAIQAEESLAVFRMLGSVEDVVFTLPLLAQAYLKLSRFEDALRVATEGRALAIENGDQRNTIAALKNMAQAFVGLDQSDQALAVEAEAMTFAMQSDISQAAWTTGIGVFDLMRLLQTGAKADFHMLEQNLIEFRKIGNWLGEGLALACLGVAHKSHGVQSTGMAYLNQSLDLFTNRQHGLGKMIVRKHLADAGSEGFELSK